MLYTLRGKIANAKPYSIDETLTQKGSAADAKAAGEAINAAKKITEDHIGNGGNPHKVTKAQVGLGNVDNTADSEKPVSTAQAVAIADAKKAGTDAQATANNALTAAQNAVNAANNAGTSAGNAETNAKTYAKEYADSLRKLFTVTVPASGWSESAPFTQAVTVDGVLGTDTPHWCVVYSDDADTALAQKEAFAAVDDLDTADGRVTFTCFEECPGVDLTIQMEVNR